MCDRSRPGARSVARVRAMKTIVVLAFSAYMLAACASAPPAPVAAPAPASTPVADPEAEVTCEQLVDHALAIGAIRKVAEGAGPNGEDEERAMPADELQEARAEFLKFCAEHAAELPQELRRCLMKASNRDEGMTCKPKG